jgi:hypothetical protein
LIFCNTLQAGIFPYKYHPTKVSVVDDESGEPIANATVGIVYRGMYYLYSPKENSDVTDNQGIATVQTAKGMHEWNFAVLEAKGYLSSFAAENIDAGSSKIPLEYTIRLRKMPKITLIVPNDYAGPLKIEMPMISTIPPGKMAEKEYTFRVSTDGSVRIDFGAAENFQWLGVLNEVLLLTTIYEDGRPIPLEGSEGVAENTNALRYITEGEKEVAHSIRGHLLYVIGNKTDSDRLIEKYTEKIEIEYEPYLKKTSQNIPKDDSFHELFADSDSAKTPK